MKSCSRAIVLIHQFINNMTHDRKRAANKADLADFLCRLSNGADRMPIPGHLHGPYAIPGGELFNTKTALFIGIVERRLPDAP
jgi:murein endopeptidase